jgi:hypothetical protein
MERWIAAVCQSRAEKQYFLANRSRTLVKINRKLRNFSLEQLLLCLQELEFPLKYTDGLDRITFTTMTGPSRGYYEDDCIMIDVSRVSSDWVTSTFIHEVGHHVDEHEIASDGMELERKRRHQYLNDPYSKQDDSEYLAVGFEKFYSGDRSDRSRMRKYNPKLFRSIKRLHDQYKNR